MRYLCFLFFVFLSLSSQYSFAYLPGEGESYAQCTGSNGGVQWCSSTVTNPAACSSTRSPTPIGTCGGTTNPGTLLICRSECKCSNGQVLIDKLCKCPEGTKWDATMGGCAPITCPAGQILNWTVTSSGNTATCIDDPSGGGDGEECPNGVDPATGLCNSDNSCPSGYPKVNGQCPICPEYNSDGTCANPSSEPASSAPNSSSPDSGSAASNGSAASTPSGGDDDGDDTPGGGGSGGGSGGNNTGGSAASASSASGAGASSGTNNSWNPYSGYGNWIPIAPDSPCPNKYQDVSGQWWCAGNGIGSGSASSAASAGSAGSNSSGSAGSNSSGSSTSSSCPAKPQCKKNTGIEADDKACKKLLQEYFSACPGNPTENGLFDIDKDELGEGRPLTFKNSLEDFKTSMSDSQNVQAINDFFSFEGSGTCPVWQVQAWVFNVVIDQQCSPNIPWDLIRGVIIAVSILLAARIALH